MILKLKPEMEELLREVLEKRRPDLLKLIPPYREIDLTDFELDEVIDAVTDEFTATGLKEDDEPNQRGIRLDDLIGALAAASYDINLASHSDGYQ
jgi:hypothetical protein